MFTAQHAPVATVAQESPHALTWVVKPSPVVIKRLPLLGGMLLIAFICALILFRSFAFALGTVVLVLLPCASDLLPLTYRIAPEGARVSFGPITWLEMKWASVRSIVSIEGGMKLSAFDNPATALLESRRGISLAYPPEMASQVEGTIAALRAQTDREAQP